MMSYHQAKLRCQDLTRTEWTAASNKRPFMQIASFKERLQILVKRFPEYVQIVIGIIPMAKKSVCSVVKSA